jgi:phosphomevalonate kinase
LALSDEQILDLLDKMEKESKAIKDNMLRICWYMRGSISYDDAMMLGNTDIEIINKIIKDNLETSKKTNMPFF